MAISEKQRKFFEFLQKMEKSKKVFSANDVEKATGWKASTFKTYYAKGQLSDFVSEKGKGKFIAAGVSGLDANQFEKKLSQSKHRRALGHNCKSFLAKALLHKSKDNMMLAIELYNRPSLVNKLDGFVMLFCTAWEQLLKAKLIESDGEESIFVERKQRKETISLRDCLDKCFDKNSSVKKNIKKIVEIRDQAVHLLVPELQGVMSRIFQSGVFNYSKLFEEFSQSLFMTTSFTGMMSLVGDFELPSMPVMSSYYGDAAKDILNLAESLQKEIDSSDDMEFAIPLNVRFSITKDTENGPVILLQKAEEGMEGLQKAFIIEKAKDPEKSHPYLTKEAIDEINDRLTKRYKRQRLDKHLISVDKISGMKVFNMYDFQKIVNKLKFKKNTNEYHYESKKPCVHRYSEKAIEKIIERIMSDEKYLDKLRKGKK